MTNSLRYATDSRPTRASGWAPSVINLWVSRRVILKRCLAKIQLVKVTWLPLRRRQRIQWKLEFFDVGSPRYLLSTSPQTVDVSRRDEPKLRLRYHGPIMSRQPYFGECCGHEERLSWSFEIRPIVFNPTGYNLIKFGHVDIEEKVLRQPSETVLSGKKSTHLIQAHDLHHPSLEMINFFTPRPHSHLLKTPAQSN